MKHWPRTSHNDPFWNASNKLAQELGKLLDCDVVVGLNEFCAPTIADAIDVATEGGTTKIVVTASMMTPGGEHSENDIPEAIDRATEKRSGIDIIYAWPFSTVDVESLLAFQISKFL